jgi:hypothetical protein
MKPQSFFENVCEELTSTGDLTNGYTAAEYTKKGVEIHGYDYDEERQILSLLVHQFFQGDAVETLTKNQIEIKFKRLKTFYAKCITDVYLGMEETTESYSMAFNICQWSKQKKISKIRLIIITDGKATRSLKYLPSEVVNKIETEFKVVDIEYLHKIYLSGVVGLDFDVDVKLPTLKVNSLSSEYESYLTVLTGEGLVQIYEQFGQKLFEQNVRTFLQFRGKVNKGIRNTIGGDPEKFFAYNNGITATASGVQLDTLGNIIKIKNFQVVNGGQTTSAIYAAKKVAKLDISNISVQMKLSVVKDKSKQNDFVSKVSRYANTQNKVNESDFFSNSSFHKDFKSHSKRIGVAATGGSQRRTHWFYERVRGEYLNEQAYLTTSKKKQFQLENPKNQLLDKTFLSKSENAWRQKPDVVSKGAQYSFSIFAIDVTQELEKDNLAITEAYFKDVISRVILFRNVEKMISKSEWYSGGFRAQTVAYSISYLSFIISDMGQFLNFNPIWEYQELPTELISILETITEAIYSEITSPPEGFANIGQWCKQQRCWELVKALNIDIDVKSSLLLDNEDKKVLKKDDRELKKLDNGIEIQTFVIQLPMEKWEALSSYFQNDDSCSQMQKDILNKYSTGFMILPSEKQSKIIYQLYIKAMDEGFVFNPI